MVYGFGPRRKGAITLGDLAAQAIRGRCALRALAAGRLPAPWHLPSPASVRWRERELARQEYEQRLARRVYTILSAGRAGGGA